MGPMVRQLESSHGERVRFRRIWVDKLVVGTSDLRFVQAVTPKVGFDTTPTFLLVGSDGRLRHKHVGVTGYLDLRRELDGMLAEGAEASGDRQATPAP